MPESGSFILAPIHRSNIDTVVVCTCTRRRMRYMGKDTMWKYRWSAWFFSSMGGYPVRRDVADREAMRLSLELAGGTEPIVMFPEGTRRSGPVLRAEDMHDGPAYVACKAGIPIVPVGIGGSEDAMPKGAKGIRPVKLAIDACYVGGATLWTDLRVGWSMVQRFLLHRDEVTIERTVRAALPEARSIPPRSASRD